MAAGFQGHVQPGTTHERTGLAQRKNFGMRRAGLRVEPAPDDLAVSHHNRAYGRVGAGTAEPPAGEV